MTLLFDPLMTKAPALVNVMDWLVPAAVPVAKLLVLVRPDVPENIKKSPPLGAVPPQLVALSQLKFVPPPFHVVVWAPAKDLALPIPRRISAKELDLKILLNRKCIKINYLIRFVDL